MLRVLHPGKATRPGFRSAKIPVTQSCRSNPITSILTDMPTVCTAVVDLNNMPSPSSRSGRPSSPTIRSHKFPVSVARSQIVLPLLSFRTSIDRSPFTLFSGIRAVANVHPHSPLETSASAAQFPGEKKRSAHQYKNHRCFVHYLHPAPDKWFIGVEELNLNAGKASP